MTRFSGQRITCYLERYPATVYNALGLEYAYQPVQYPFKNVYDMLAEAVRRSCNNTMLSSNMKVSCNKGGRME